MYKIKGRFLKYLKRIAVLIITVCLVGCALVYALIHSEKKAQIEDPERVDILVVLGAGLWGDQVSPQLGRRLDTAYDLLVSYPHLQVVVSGGQGPDEWITEAEAMKTYLVKRGIEGARITMESRSTSTYENLVYTLDLLAAKGQRPEVIGLITTDFHVFRAKMLLGRLGVKGYAQAAPNIPSIVLKNNIREIFALIKDLLISY